jgi:linoleoyl-CoA desaturase
VQETCDEFGVTYNVHPSFPAAIGSHFRWLVRMGKPERAAEDSAAMN